MALYPGATKRLIAPGSNDPAISVLGAILHVDAGDSKSLFGYFNGPSGGIESHFHVPKVGAPEQYRDTGREADANLKANSFLHNGKLYGFISIETQGLGAGEWNPHQLDEIKKLLTWASKTHNFPLRRCPGPFSPGVGYHTMWGAPSEWTPVSKDCPGHDRIKQFTSVLVPWFNTHPTVEDDVQLTDPVGPDRSDPKTALTLGEAANRGGYAYWAVRPGGDIYQLIQTQQKTIADLTSRLAKLEAAPKA